MKICYNCSANVVLNDPDWSKKAAIMKKAGVSRMWLFGYFYGSWETSPEDVARAKKILEADGFEVKAINVPFGHGGNALDPGDPNFRSDIGEGWRETWNKKGQVQENTTCPNDKAISDTRDVILTLKQLGIDEVFFDDDLRFGQWGPATQGCFCPDCLEKFRNIYGSFSVDDIDRDHALTAAWKHFQCENLTNFVQKVSVDGVKLGVMVMHNGDERHGIDIKMLKERVPGVFFRVGEGHFHNEAFEADVGKPSIARSISNHMALIGDNTNTWSESTVFPKNALTPANLVEKIKLELHTGLKNLYLMSGTVFLDDAYFNAIADALPLLQEIDAQTTSPNYSLGDPIWQI